MVDESQGDQGVDPGSRRVDTGLACLISVMRFLQIPADAAQLKHQLGRGEEPFGADEIVRAAKLVKVKARKASPGFEKLDYLPLPAVAELKDGTFMLLARASDGKVLVQSPVEPQPQTLERAEFEEIWSGRLVLLTTRAQIAGAGRKFATAYIARAVTPGRFVHPAVFIEDMYRTEHHARGSIGELVVTK